LKKETWLKVFSNYYDHVELELNEDNEIVEDEVKDGGSFVVDLNGGYT